METLAADKVLDAILVKKLNCNFRDINEYADAHQIVHPEIYVEVTRDDIMHAIETNPNKFYWEGGNVFKQEIVLCPICGDIHRKYPKQDNYNKILKMIKILNSIEVNLGENNIN